MSLSGCTQIYTHIHTKLWVGGMGNFFGMFWDKRGSLWVRYSHKWFFWLFGFIIVFLNVFFFLGERDFLSMVTVEMGMMRVWAGMVLRRPVTMTSSGTNRTIIE